MEIVPDILVLKHIAIKFITLPKRKKCANPEPQICEDSLDIHCYT